MALFQFNGYDLTNYFKLIKVEHEIGNERSISTDSAPAIGVNVQNVDIGAKKIKLTVSLATRDLADMTFIDPNEPAPVDNVQFYRVREEAARILHTKKAVKLFLPTEPERYYLALVKGEVSLKGISDWYDEATIEFLVPDGVAHSTTYKRVTDYQEKDGKMIFSIDNEGSTDAYPIITLKANAENGYYGLVSDKFAFEAGNIEEADGKIISKAEVLYDFRDDRIPQAFAKGAKNVGITNVTGDLHGTLEIQNVWGRPHIGLKNPNANINQLQTASLTLDIPPDSSGNVGALNEYIWWRQIFWAGSISQYGFLKLTVSDADGNFLYGVETFKRSLGLESEYNALASDGYGGFRFLKQWSFLATEYEDHNPFNEPRGWSDIKREDDKVTFYWWGTYNTFTIPEIKGKKSAKIHLTISNIPSKSFVTHAYFDQLLYIKTNNAFFEDIPNRYIQGSNLIINSEDDTLTLNNLLNLDEIVDGSLWPVIPPGSSEIEIIQSPWAKKKPSVTIEFEERWI
ncbi:hypothetical protein CHPC929_0017 [Streptococcus phage CHPC929]|nr:hypothetical protein CHPC929_0017 [Streptococcus phage CHPC929]